jgi:Holliday junction DNA helicase RuvA
MISYIHGKLVEKNPTHVVVDTGGVAFRLMIPLSSFQVLGEVGDDVRIMTHLHMREDSLKLYGFATTEERDAFEILISVTGIGPRSAQSILSGLSVADLKKAIRAQDLGVHTTAPGIVKKTAERLILELREKIGEEPAQSPGTLPTGGSPTEEESVLALVSLGYKRARAQDMVRMLMKEKPSLTVEEIIRKALRVL